MKKLVSIIAIVLLSTSAIMAQSNMKPQDFQSVQNVLAQWTQLQDDGNLDGFMKLWATNPSFKNPFGEFKSFEEIKGFEQNYLGGFAKGKRHMETNVIIVSDANNKNMASATMDLLVVEVKEIPFIAATVRANVELVKEDKLWKVKSVTLAIDEGFNKLVEAASK